ncbi:MAG TPA: hypothetical protein P5186_16580 [Candidatus Paceibacterota bacterium]|nr:hypothetical protein [Verrucomicrobiota bacterium]HRY49666.1 hypothetical protein [Candidatus Paceibacterota bacterium]HSA00943.1 hypothetical protein [Candidatus Paceibacterota bacterium]
MKSNPAIPPAGLGFPEARWRPVPLVLVALGVLGILVGAIRDPRQFGYSYLLAYMFFLSVGLGSLCLVMLHHIFDASWSVPVRRFVEHLAFVLPVMALLFLPLVWAAPQVYAWMTPAGADHALHAKAAYLNKPFFYARAAFYFLVWSVLAWKLRYESLQQDRTGGADCTYRLRRYSAAGIFLFAVTVTLAAIDWMKSMQHQWFSTMYGVYYFSGSVWATLALVYFLTVVLKRTGPLAAVVHQRQLRDLGVLLLAFTIFSAYIHFSQYFLIWNAAIPEETFWYVQREKGTWWTVGLILVFGHFLVPFLCLLRIDAKHCLPLMIPLCVWVWLMHYVDLAFNIMPPLHPEGFRLHYLDVSCFLAIGGLLTWHVLRSLAAHPVYPVQDPRLLESLTYVEVPPPAIAEAVHSVRE